MKNERSINAGKRIQALYPWPCDRCDNHTICISTDTEGEAICEACLQEIITKVKEAIRQQDNK